MPLISKELIPWLRLGHGLYNSLVILSFFYQASLGLMIRRARKANAPLPLTAIWRHRKLGPVLATMGIIGFFIGLTVVTLDTRNYLEFWPHLFTGFAIVLLLISTYLLSKRIKGPDAPVRNLHLSVGIAIICLYLLEAFLGIGILL